MLTTEQWEFRKTGLGGSDISAILGLNPWKTPLQIYMEKRGELPPQADNRFTKWGSLLEPVIMQAYEEETGTTVSKPNFMIRSAEYPFMLANIDGLIEKSENGKRTYCKVVEIKTAIQFKANEWGEINTDQLPDYYLTQAHHYMTVLDADECDVVVLIGGNDFRIYNVKRDLEISKMFIEREKEFWDMVQNGTPPAIHNKEDWLLKFGEDATENTYNASEDDFKLLKSLFEIQQKIKSLESFEDNIKTQLMERMNNYKTIALDGQKLGGITVANKIMWNTEELSKIPELVEKYKTKISTSAYFQLSRTKNVTQLLAGEYLND